MKRKAILLTLFMLVVFAFGQAQTLSTKETKVVFVVHQQTDEVKSIHLLSQLVTIKDELNTKYPNCKFYLGVLNGKYEVKNNQIIPKEASILTVYTNKELFQNKYAFFEQEIQAGDKLKLGSIPTEVLSKNEGKVVLKTLEN